MIVGVDKVRECADGVLAKIEEDADSDIAEIAEVMVVVSVHFGTTDDGDGDVGSTYYRASSARSYVQRGLLEEARRALDLSVRRRDEDD